MSSSVQYFEKWATNESVAEPAVDSTQPREFDASWDELRDFRMAIPDGIREFRDEAQRRVSEGEEDIQLVFPEYPLSSWENE